jgi:hypothetical protein
MKTKRVYFVVNCKKEEKKKLKEIAISEGFETLAQFMRSMVRNVITAHTPKP